MGKVIGLFMPSGAAGAPHSPVERLWVVRDRQTHRSLICGSYAEATAYVRAFGLCYVEEVG